MFERSRDAIEIDITYLCNLTCPNCNRSCPQAPTSEHMSVEQVEAFVADSIERGKKWGKIRVLGGEPTIHPEFSQIMAVLMSYQSEFSPETSVQLVTNGYGEKVERAIAEMERLYPELVIQNSSKDRGPPFFTPFHVAPMDLLRYRFADYKSSCRIAAECGFGLTPYGYYPCALAGAIDRVFGLDRGRKEMPSDDDGMSAELAEFCTRCGRFKDAGYWFRLISEQESSRSWTDALERFARGAHRSGRRAAGTPPR